MKLYFAAGQYVGTHADAKKLDKDFSPIEVPTDKKGLINYLNVLVSQIGLDKPDEFETVVERHDPPIEPETETLSETQYLQQFFDKAPITLRLELAVRAIDAADAELRGKARVERSWGGRTYTTSDPLEEVETDHMSEEEFIETFGEDEDMFS